MCGKSRPYNLIDSAIGRQMRLCTQKKMAVFMQDREFQSLRNRFKQDAELLLHGNPVDTITENCKYLVFTVRYEENMLIISSEKLNSFLVIL